MNIFQKKTRGSVLIFTLLVLAILLSASLSAALVVIVGKNSSRATQKSILSFQVADGAVENVLKRVYKNSDSTLSNLASNLYGSATCSGGTISGSLPSSAGTYKITFLDNSGKALQCSGTGYSTYNQWRSKLVRLVSIGSYAGTTRAIDVGVKP